MDKNIDVLEERIRVAKLLDYYGDLLKDSRKRLCEAYISDDLSLSEIAEEVGMSRQGVHDHLKRSIKQLEDFDKELKLIEKAEQIEKISSNIRLITSENDGNLKKKINKMLDELEAVFG